MRRIISLCIFVLALIPVTVSAVWWKPSTWNVLKKTAEVSKPQITATTTEETVPVYVEPSVDELLKRIVELEDKLDKARASAKSVTAKAAATTTTTATTGFSEKEIADNIYSARVTFATTTGSWSGAIIDTEGHGILPYIAVKDTVSPITITLANGTQKTAAILGFNEVDNIAIFQLSNKTSSAYIKVNHDSGIKVGDKMYVFGPHESVVGTVSQKNSVIEINSSAKPTEGDLAVNAQGAFVGFSDASTCKVIEEMKTCLTYKTVLRNSRETFPRIILGMKLYKDKKNSTKEEVAVRGQLERMYMNVKDSHTFEYAVTSVMGKNNFDYFNEKLALDEQGKITKLYLAKLKISAGNMGKAFETLKERAYTLNTFLLNEVSDIATLDDYQRTVLKKIELDTTARIKDYKENISFWSKKKNEYDALLLNPADATHDYLMDQGLLIEDTAASLRTEQQEILKIFSGETLRIF